MQAEIVVPEDAIISLIRLALACEVSKKPIRREDIQNLILGENGGRLLRPLLVKANERLAKDFGMQLVPLPTIARALSTLTIAGRRAATKKAEPSQNPTASTSYCLIACPERKRGYHRQPDQLGLLTLILVLIHLSGGEMEESQLLESLNSWSAGRYFSCVQDGFAEFKRQKYLTSGKKSDDQNVTVYSAGPRAQVEFPPRALVDFIMGLGSLMNQANQLKERLEATFRIPQ
ncbi:putative mage family protein [Paramicrosporidium saccamoebae]|uniref:Putative mage family protein n=1 Tax=Paramicrosporidium saccamoebae TaxID=1246581 RepID=A0A2H9TNY0_9FUNG|nr:putative mage family protein [Paramicrosporidium saccamoebae]